MKSSKRMYYRGSFRVFISLLGIIIAASMIQERAAAQSFWEHKSVFNGGMAIAASDSQDFVFTSGGFDPARTQDYGKTWKSIFVDSPRIEHSIAGLVHPSGSLIILGCDDVFEINNTFGILGIAVGVLVRSTDGGSTWTDSTIGSSDTSKPHNPIGAIAALDSNHIFLPIGGDPYLISSDGGASWQSISCPVSRHYAIANPVVFLVNPVAAYPAPNTLVVAEVDSSYPWANYPCKIFRSTDLGATWSKGFQTSDNIMKFAFISASVGFAAGFIADQTSHDETAIIDKTTDGGLTWFNNYTNRFPDAVGLMSIAFADSLNGIAVGLDGLILRCTDGGTNWVRETADITESELPDLEDVAFPSKTKAMIASAGGEVLIYRPEGLLDMPNITYPKPIGPGNLASVDSNFDATWDPVTGADRYSLWVTWDGGTNPVVLLDSNIHATTYHLTSFDTIPAPGYNQNQYTLNVQAFSSDRKSNVAHRVFRTFVPPSSSVAVLPSVLIGQYLYPNPARDLLNVEGFSGKVSIVDALGRTRYCPWQDGKLDVSGLPAGIYYVIGNGSRARFVKE